MDEILPSANTRVPFRTQLNSTAQSVALPYHKRQLLKQSCEWSDAGVEMLWLIIKFQTEDGNRFPVI